MNLADLANKRKPINLGGVWSIVLWIAGIYGALVLAVFLGQSALLYFPSRDLIANPREIGLAYQDVEIVTTDDVTLHGWYVPAVKPRGVLLFFHGNAGNISQRLESLKLFNQLGLDTLIFDYRGYGKSEGKISEQGSYLDAEAAWRYLTETKGIPSHQILLFGRSLGGALAAYLAGRRQAKGVIVESGFISIPELAAQIYPFLPARWISRFHYDSLNRIKKSTCPVLIIHSADDEIIPISHGRALFNAAPQSKQFLQIQGGHNDGFLQSVAVYVQGLDNFLAGLE